MLWRSLALCGLALTLTPCAQAAEPIEGKTVYIDAGHGGEDSGAVGNGLFEKDINLAVSEYVTDKLKAEGANPVAARFDDHFLTLEERVVKASVIRPIFLLHSCEFRGCYSFGNRNVFSV